MTPTMSPSQITFGRRTQVIEEGLRKDWAWGRRTSIMLDEREQLYSDCFPPMADSEPIPSYLAKQMIERRRERMVMDSLQDLIRHMARDARGTNGGDHRVRWLEAVPARSVDDGAAHHPPTGAQDPIPGSAAAGRRRARAAA